MSDTDNDIFEDVRMSSGSSGSDSSNVAAGSSAFLEDEDLNDFEATTSRESGFSEKARAPPAAPDGSTIDRMAQQNMELEDKEGDAAEILARAANPNINHRDIKAIRVKGGIKKKSQVNLDKAADRLHVALEVGAIDRKEFEKRMIKVLTLANVRKTAESQGQQIFKNPSKDETMRSAGSRGSMGTTEATGEILDDMVSMKGRGRRRRVRANRNPANQPDEEMESVGLKTRRSQTSIDRQKAMKEIKPKKSKQSAEQRANAAAEKKRQDLKVKDEIARLKRETVEKDKTINAQNIQLLNRPSSIRGGGGGRGRGGGAKKKKGTQKSINDILHTLVNPSFRSRVLPIKKKGKKPKKPKKKKKGKPLVQSDREARVLAAYHYP